MKALDSKEMKLQQDGIKSVIRCGEVFRKRFATEDFQWHSGKLEVRNAKETA